MSKTQEPWTHRVCLGKHGIITGSHGDRGKSNCKGRNGRKPHSEHQGFSEKVNRIAMPPVPTAAGTLDTWAPPARCSGKAYFVGTPRPFRPTLQDPPPLDDDGIWASTCQNKTTSFTGSKVQAKAGASWNCTEACPLLTLRVLMLPEGVISGLSPALVC